MKKSLFIFFFCWVPGFLFAQSPDSSVVFKAFFLQHEMQCYEVAQTMYTMVGKDTTDLNRICFQGDVYVTDSTESGYILNWKIYNYSINTGDASLQKLIALAKPIEVSYRISKPGVLTDFLTGEHVTTCLEAALPVVLAPYLNRKDADARAEVSRIYDLRENMETLLLRFIVQFHQVYGLGYKLGEVVSVPTEVNSRFSSSPIKATTFKKLVKYDLDNHVAVLSTATNMDKQEFLKAITEYTKADSVSLSSLNQTNMGSIVMDLNTGWVVWSFDQREVQVGSKKYGDLIEIQYK
jgi:hypothetical protein